MLPLLCRCSAKKDAEGILHELECARKECDKLKANLKSPLVQELVEAHGALAKTELEVTQVSSKIQWQHSKSNIHTALPHDNPPI
jgi:hypothetical protein